MDTRKYYAGTPRSFERGSVFAMTFASVLKSGKFVFGLQVSSKEFEKKHDHHREIYHQDIPLNCKMPVADICEMLMVMVIDKETEQEFRGQVLECPNENGEVHVLNVDTGEISKCFTKNLFYISREYLQEPFDSVLCHLDGLVFYEETLNITKALEELVDLTPGQTVLGICTGYNGNGGLPTFQIQDKSSLSLQTRILNYILKEIAGRLPEPQEEKIASIIHVEAEGYLFIHMDDSFVFDLEGIINELEPDELLKAELRDRSIESDKVYLAEDLDAGGGALYRCTVVEEINSPDGSDTKVRIFFIDYGNKAVVPKNSLKCAGDINIALQEIPPLTHKAYLKGIRSITDIDNFLTKAIGSMFIVKAEGASPNRSPCVSLWMKDAKGNEVSFIESMIDAGFAKRD